MAALPLPSTLDGRPPLPKNLRALIVTMARENPSWGEERIANELSLKLGWFVDPRTIGKYLKLRGRPRLPSVERWARHSFTIMQVP